MGRFFKLTALLFLILTPKSLFAWTEAKAWRVAFQGELLYFITSFDETYFVINGSQLDGAGNLTPEGKKNNNPVGYNLGFRAEWIVGLCPPLDCRVRWTHVYSKSKERVSNFDPNPQLWPTELIPNKPHVAEPFTGFASSNIRVMYQKLELLLDEKLWDFCGFRFALRQGAEWSYIRYHENVDYVDVGTPASEEIFLHAHTKGVGPQLGVIALMDFWNLCGWFPRNFSLKLMTTATLIAANSKAKISSIDTSGFESKVTETSFWRFVPEWVLNIGFQYMAQCWIPISFEIGYEINMYIRGTSKLIFTDGDHPGLSFNHYSDFYAHGLFFALGASF